MHRRLLAATMASLLMFSIESSLQAAPLNLFHHPASEKVSGKMVSFTVRNDGQSTLLLKAGEEQMSIEPGKTASVKLPEGSQVVNVNETSKHPAGTVIVTVSRVLQGNTLAVS